MIFQQGDPSQYAYVVESGEYTMHLRQAGDKPLERYTRGAVFGELALLYNTPQQATVKCKAAGALWKLDRRVTGTGLERRASCLLPPPSPPPALGEGLGRGEGEGRR